MSGFINDPAVPDPTDPTKLDEKMFKGKAMTYYGRWTYKFEEAARQGAAALHDGVEDRLQIECRAAERLAHLLRACSPHRALGLVELEAGRLIL